MTNTYLLTIEMDSCQTSRTNYSSLWVAKMIADRAIKEGYVRRLFITDNSTGEILYFKEND